ncbi:hypothetical protein AAW12_14535 [Sphingobacterium sp. Ag1]|uniref:hypothetical protein n=1 Tax=Sphingobacterium sp. Ag1 TaxID=1643451 RepID=UPI0006278139|nr:hypothetical protein [Sphingobacterium sp. Ag1]KKO90757.1 hypothetical protein AAW12_14535 [Sphingobacterium sp. Ag1]
MAKSIYRQVIWKLLFIGFLNLIIGCSRDSFHRVTATDLVDYESTKGVKWANSDSSIILTSVIDNGIFLQEYNILLALKYYNGTDSIYYVLKDTQIGNYIVKDNKLYIYDRSIGSPGTVEGWYETGKGNRRMLDSVFFTGDSILKSCPDLKSFDKLAKAKPYGIYKIDHDTLKVVAQNGQEQKKYLENIYVPGFYYFSSPGLGLERIYDLSLIEEKLKKSTPSTLDPEYY